MHRAWHYPKEPNGRESMSSTLDKIAEFQHRIEVMQAFEDGKQIQYNNKATGGKRWCDGLSPVWDWTASDYRIKPEPKVIYVNEYDKGQVDFYYKSKEQARMSSTTRCLRVGVEYKEVIKD
jgi:hypothetical protein